VRFLDTTSGRGRFAGSLGSELFAGSLTSSGFSCGLFSSSHFNELLKIVIDIRFISSLLLICLRKIFFEFFL